MARIDRRRDQFIEWTGVPLTLTQFIDWTGVALPLTLTLIQFIEWTGVAQLCVCIHGEGTRRAMQLGWCHDSMG